MAGQGSNLFYVVERWHWLSLLLRCDSHSSCCWDVTVTLPVVEMWQWPFLLLVAGRLLDTTKSADACFIMAGVLLLVSGLLGFPLWILKRREANKTLPPLLPEEVPITETLMKTGSVESSSVWSMHGDRLQQLFEWLAHKKCLMLKMETGWNRSLNDSHIKSVQYWNRRTCIKWDEGGGECVGHSWPTSLALSAWCLCSILKAGCWQWLRSPCWWTVLHFPRRSGARGRKDLCCWYCCIPDGFFGCTLPSYDKETPWHF